MRQVSPHAFLVEYSLILAIASDKPPEPEREGKEQHQRIIPNCFWCGQPFRGQYSVGRWIEMRQDWGHLGCITAWRRELSEDLRAELDRERHVLRFCEL